MVPLGLEKEMYEISLRMRLLRAAQELVPGPEAVALSEREILLLELISERGKASISEIGSFFPEASSGTISTDISRLWKEKELVDKSIDPDNERSRQVQLTPKGRQALDQIKKNQAARISLFMKAISVKEEERKVLEEILARAIEHLDQRMKDFARAGGQ